MNIWVAVYRITWILIAVVCLVAAVCLFLPKYSKYRGLQRQKAEAVEQKRLEEIKIRRLQLQQARFASDPSFVERTARAEGMVKTNETVCKLTGALSDAPDEKPVRGSGLRQPGRALQWKERGH